MGSQENRLLETVNNEELLKQEMRGLENKLCDYLWNDLLLFPGDIAMEHPCLTTVEIIDAERQGVCLCSMSSGRLNTNEVAHYLKTLHQLAVNMSYITVTDTGHRFWMLMIKAVEELDSFISAKVKI